MTACARPNHIGFTVSALDPTIDWLVDAFGFRLTSRAGRPTGMAQALTGVEGANVEIAFLEIDGLVLELIRYHTPDRDQPALPDPATRAAAHVALTVPDIEQSIADAHKHNAQVLGEIVTVPAGPNRGARLAYLRHPAGVFVELIQPGQGH